MSDPGIPAPPGPEDFEAIYAGSRPPWDIGRPQAAFVKLAEAGAIKGRVLDIGCGTGEHSLMTAELGLETTGVDISSTAISLAKQKAAERGLEIRFGVADALELPELGEFDTVIDCGVFHVFDDDDRARFVSSVASVLRSGGSYHLLCFSDSQPGEWGPRRVSERELRESFAGSRGWRIDSIEESRLEITIDPDGARAWIVAVSRL
jgi:cyclopropane fatty-acyl-phospholipid synthase-like methyltransferase